MVRDWERNFAISQLLKSLYIYLKDKLNINIQACLN